LTGREAIDSNLLNETTVTPWTNQIGREGASDSKEHGDGTKATRARFAILSLVFIVTSLNYATSHVGGWLCGAAISK